MQGELPSHPELLDWLASKFVRDGWSLKKLNKLIMLSEAYRQDSRAPMPEASVGGSITRMSHTASRFGIGAVLIGALIGVVAQRLVRRICSECRVAYQPPADEIAFYEQIGGDPAFRRLVARFYAGVADDAELRALYPEPRERAVGP